MPPKSLYSRTRHLLLLEQGLQQPVKRAGESARSVITNARDVDIVPKSMLNVHISRKKQSQRKIDTTRIMARAG